MNEIDGKSDASDPPAENETSQSRADGTAHSTRETSISYPCFHYITATDTY